MDVGAYLRKQGWKGEGHPLGNHGRGIKKPLLIAHKQDQLGLGKKKAAHNTDDQWWMRAFDASLQTIGTGQESTLGQIREKGVNRGGLYGFFVKGEVLAGTITTFSESSTVDAESSTAPTPRTATPPTSVNDSDFRSASDNSSEETDSMTKAKKAKKAKMAQKRKREEEDEPVPNKKLRLKPNNGLTFDEDTLVKSRAVLRKVGREVKHELMVRSRRGEYGAYIDPKALQGKNKAKVRLDDPDNPGKTLTYKQARYKRQSVMREVSKELRKEKVIAALMKGDLPNPCNLTKEQAITQYQKVQQVIDALENQEKQEKAQVKEAKKEAKLKEREAQKAAAAELRAQRMAQREAEQQAAKDAENQLIASKIAQLTPEERTKYEERAAAKDQSLETYVLRRIQKKNEKKAEKKLTSAPSDVLFFADTEGDSQLVTKAQVEHAKLNKQPIEIEFTPLPDGSCPLDPSLWEDKVVKTLPKAVREARRKWLEQRRIEKKIAAGKIKPGQAPTLSRAEKKQKTIASLTKQILTDQGINKGANKEQRNLARRQARKVTKEEKKKKREGKGTEKLRHNMKNRHRVSERAKARNEAAKQAAANRAASGANAIAVGA